MGDRAKLALAWAILALAVTLRICWDWPLILISLRYWGLVR